jgi:integrase
MPKRKTQQPYGMGEITQRPNGRSQVTVLLGYDNNGKRIRRSFTADSVTECREWGAEKLRLHKRGFDVDSSREPFSSFVKSWLPTYIAARNLKPKTRVEYERLLGDATETLGHLGLSEITTAHIDRYVNSFPTQASKHRHFSILRLAFNAAVKRGQIEVSPLMRYEGPRMPPPAEKELLTAEELARLFAVVQGHRLEPILKLLLSTGLRIGECLALRWQNIDLDKQTLFVSRTVQLIEREYIVSTPKTANAIRTIALSEPLCAVLEAHKIVQDYDFHLSQIEPSGGLIFCNDQGTFLNNTTLGTQLHQALKEANILRRVTFHHLRHQHASMAIAEGADVYAVSRRLGHHNASFTLERYGHLLPDSSDIAVTVADSLLVG